MIPGRGAQANHMMRANSAHGSWLTINVFREMSLGAATSIPVPHAVCPARKPPPRPRNYRSPGCNSGFLPTPGLPSYGSNSVERPQTAGAPILRAFAKAGRKTCTRHFDPRKIHRTRQGTPPAVPTNPTRKGTPPAVPTNPTRKGRPSAVPINPTRRAHQLNEPGRARVHACQKTPGRRPYRSAEGRFSTPTTATKPCPRTFAAVRRSPPARPEF
jgi:hypothetical protein